MADNNAESIQAEIERLQTQLIATNAEMDAAPANKLGDLSLRAAGMQNALTLLAKRKQAAEIAAIDADIARQEAAINLAQKNCSLAVAESVKAEEGLRQAQAAAQNVTMYTDAAIEAVANATAAKMREAMKVARAHYAIDFAIDEG